MSGEGSAALVLAIRSVRMISTHAFQSYLLS